MNRIQTSLRIGTVASALKDSSPARMLTLIRTIVVVRFQSFIETPFDEIESKGLLVFSVELSAGFYKAGYELFQPSEKTISNFKFCHVWI